MHLLAGLIMFFILMSIFDVLKNIDVVLIVLIISVSVLIIGYYSIEKIKELYRHYYRKVKKKKAQIKSLQIEKEKKQKQIKPDNQNKKNRL